MQDTYEDELRQLDKLVERAERNYRRHLTKEDTAKALGQWGSWGATKLTLLARWDALAGDRDRLVASR